MTAMTPILSLWPCDETRLMALKVSAQVGKLFVPESNLFAEVACVAMAADTLCGEISKSYRSLITLTMADTTLHTVVVLPVYLPDAVSRLETVTRACGMSPDRLSLHVVGLKGGLARVFGDEEADTVDTAREKENVAAIDRLAVEGPLRFSYTLIDDYAANGAPIGFTFDSLSKYLALLFSALIHRYHTVLPPAMMSDTAGTNIAIGLGSIRFDRAGACERFMHKAFLNALDAAGTALGTVDSQKVADRADRLLVDIGCRYPRFFDREVLPLYRDTPRPEGEIVGMVAAPMDAEMASIERELTAFIHDKSMPFPEKEGVLACLLGRDNPRLKGMQYDREARLLDDACSMPVGLYVDSYNNESERGGELPVRGDFEKLKKYAWSDADHEMVESDENLLAFDPLPEIKRLKRGILNTTAFIRTKSRELEALLQADDERRKMKSHPEGYGDDTPRDRRREEIKEQPLDEVYRPSDTIKPRQSVDLRRYFSAPRDQGNLGSCSTFASVSMYEAEMNRFAGKGTRSDMSERFVYYYSNVITGRPEGGSNYREQLGVLGKHGVCRESLFGYSTTDIDKEPPAEAVEDAANHRVLKALQIPLRDSGDKAECLKENHRLLTCALSEGHPVGIALKVYDTLGRRGSFVNRPDAEDVSAGGEGYHAMVLAGYSEAEKCYIVRNSWGEGFCDKGYCYISAAYVDDPEYNNFACLISDTTDSRGRTADEVPGLTAGFAASETEIKIAAIRNALDEAQVILHSQQALYDEHYKYYQWLMQRLCMPGVRDALRKNAELAAAGRFADIAVERRRLNDSFVGDLKAFKRSYIKIALAVGGVALLDDIVFGLLWWHRSGFPGWEICASAVILTVVAIFVALNYKWYVRRKRRQLNDRLADLAQDEERARRELLEKQLRFHVAGMWLDRFHELSLRLNSTYDRLVAFNGNLCEWYDEDTRWLNGPPRQTGSMFIYLGDRDLLDKCFEEHRADIIASLDLMEAFDGYAAGAQTIEEARKRLRNNVMEVIAPIFADFRMVEFLTGRFYPYLPSTRLDREVCRLLSVGQPSVRHGATDPPVPARITMLQITEAEIPSWQAAADPCFPYRPRLLPTSDPCSLDLVTVQPLPLTSLR